VQIAIHETGIDDLLRRLDNITNPQRYRFVRVKALRAGIRIAEDRAKDRYVPVDVGNLKNSIHVGAVTEDRAELLATADYAAYVEFGTRNMAAQPYMRPSVQNHIGEIEAVMTAVIDEALNG
jgi:HK97 gp10 family phage protein